MVLQEFRPGLTKTNLKKTVFWSKPDIRIRARERTKIFNDGKPI